MAAIGLLLCIAIACGGDDEQADSEQDLAATIDAVVADASATKSLAESESMSATSEPANSPVPAATPIVVGTPGDASGTPPNVATSTPTGPPPLAALPVSNSASFLDDLSESEKTCVIAGVPPDRLSVLLDDPESATPDERSALVGCLDNDTQLRLFLTPVLSATGPLSAESSQCLRNSYSNTNVGALMLATIITPGSNADPEAALATAMVSSMLSLSCLNESEFRSAGPAMGAGSEDYESFQCVVDYVGGTQSMAQLMHTGGGFPAPLFEAAFACDVQLSGAPSG